MIFIFISFKSYIVICKMMWFLPNLRMINVRHERVILFTNEGNIGCAIDRITNCTVLVINKLMILNTETINVMKYVSISISWSSKKRRFLKKRFFSCTLLKCIFFSSLTSFIRYVSYGTLTTWVQKQWSKRKSHS